MHKRIGFVLCLVLAAAAGCGDDDGGSKTDGSTLPDGSRPDGGGPGDSGIPGMDGGGMDATVGPDGTVPGEGGTAPTSALIGPAGGTVMSADGRLTVDIPQGALSRPTQIKITALTMAPTGGVGQAYEISPTFEVLDPRNQGRLPIVTLVYANAELQGGSAADLQLGRFISGGWAQLTDTLANPKTMKIRGTLPKLGTVGLFTGFCKACDPPPAPSTACNPATPTCRFNITDFDPDGEDGKCVPYGTGCGRCVPTCDSDNDGYCPGADDFNDNDPHIHRGAPELCNSLDDNCNGHTDEGCTACTTDAQCTFNRESCQNGFCGVCEKQCSGACTVGFGPGAVAGRCHSFGNDCSLCVYVCDLDGDGYCPTDDVVTGQRGGDCDETNAAMNPGKVEICGNNIDDNCNGFVDDGCAACAADTDCPRADNYCLGGVCLGCRTDACTLGMACTVPAGVNGAGMNGTCKSLGKGCTTCVKTCDFDGDSYCATEECDDGDPKIFPGAPEICGDTKDNNCNNHVDEGCFGCTANDQCLNRPNARGQEVCNTATGACDACLGRTCTFPDASMCGNFVVYDPTMMAKGVAARCIERGNGCGECVPTCDGDGDGRCPDPVGPDAGGINYAEIPAENKGDCDDKNPAVYTGAPEICGNDIDDDCDGRADEDCDVCMMGNMCGTAETCSNGR